MSSLPVAIEFAGRGLRSAILVCRSTFRATGCLPRRTAVKSLMPTSFGCWGFVGCRRPADATCAIFLPSNRRTRARAVFRVLSVRMCPRKPLWPPAGAAASNRPARAGKRLDRDHSEGCPGALLPPQLAHSLSQPATAFPAVGVGRRGGARATTRPSSNRLILPAAISHRAAFWNVGMAAPCPSTPR